MNVPMVYSVGFSRGSIPSFERINKGTEADMKVATVEWRNVTGAMEKGKLQGSD